MSVKWIQEKGEGKRALYTFDTMVFLGLCSEAAFWGLNLDDPGMTPVFDHYVKAGKVKAFRITTKTREELRAEIKRNFPDYLELGPKEDEDGL